MSEFYSGNRYLTMSEMAVNASYIAKALTARGWTLNAVAGMLGNMQSESTINPAIWQNLDAGNTSLGFGLVQWTPSTKYTSWCADNNLDPSHMDSALARIEYELENGLQWIQTDEYPLSFAQFKVSTQPANYLGLAFLHNYERPADMNQPQRGTQATEWFNKLSGATPTPTPDKRVGLPLWMIIQASRKVF